MFDHQHYVPVMRMKPAELRALQAFDSNLRLVTTPLLECPPRVLRGCDSVAKLERRAVHFARYLSGWTGQRIFLDLGMLSSDIVSPALHAVVKQMTPLGFSPCRLSLSSQAKSPRIHALFRLYKIASEFPFV